MKDGGKICLNGTNSEIHPYTCEKVGPVKDKPLKQLDKSVEIHGLFTKAHITCEPRYGNLVFKYPENRLFKLTLSNLVFLKFGFDLLNVSCFRVFISSCRFINSSNAVRILQKDSRVITTSSIIVTDTEFFYNKLSVSAILFKGLVTIRISRCVFQGTKGQYDKISGVKETKAAVYIKVLGYPNMVYTDSSIVDSVFQDLGHENNGLALSYRSYGYFVTGSLLVFNSTFLCNENAILVKGAFYVQLRHVTINSTFGYVLLSGGPPKINARAPDVWLFLDHCTLSNNRRGINMATTRCVNVNGNVCQPSSQILVVKNSLFVGGNETQRLGDGIRLIVKAYRTLHRPNFIKAIVILENVTFQEFLHRVVYIKIQRNVTGLINVTNCRFLNNSEFVYRLDDRPTIRIALEKEDPPKCLNRNHNSKFFWHNKTQFPVVFENCMFKNNVAISGALNIFNGNVTIKNCTFKDNEGSNLGGHIKMKIGYGTLNIINSNFLQSRLSQNTNVERMSNDGCFLYSESAGPVIIKNSSFTANINKKFYPILAVTKSSLIQVDAASTIKCPSGRWLKMDINKKTEGFELSKRIDICTSWMKANYVKIFCEECPTGFYSLQRGFISGLTVTKEDKCLKCPYGASCENGTIKAKENFWGMEDFSSIPPSFHFFHCPSEYCSRSSHSTHYGHNSCHGRRDGVLCGKYFDGYSEALYSNSCRKNERCNDSWFWLATMIYVAAFAVYIVFKPPIFSELLKYSLWFKYKPGFSNLHQTSSEENKEHDSGYLKIHLLFLSSSRTGND